MKILFFPRYAQKGASSRYRFYKYLPYYKEYSTKIYPFFDDCHIPAKKYSTLRELTYLATLYTKRMFYILKGLGKNRVIFLQYELLPYIPFTSFFFKLISFRYIVDYDDAIFHQYDQHPNRWVQWLLKHKIKNLMKHAAWVITGSPYLTRYALQFTPNVTEIPTSVIFLITVFSTSGR